MQPTCIPQRTRQILSPQVAARVKDIVMIGPCRDHSFTNSNGALMVHVILCWLLNKQATESHGMHAFLGGLAKPAGSTGSWGTGSP